MAKIPVYDAPDRAIRTEREGFSAFETAGRRIGPAYDKAATDIRDTGNVAASIYKQRLWPWDILELEQNNTGEVGSGSGRRTRDGNGGGGGFKTEGGHHSGFDLGGAGATGRLGNVAAAMAEHFTGTRTNGGGKLLSPGGQPGPGADLDPLRSRIINDPRALQPGKFPDKTSSGEDRFDPNKDPNATTWPRGRYEQPANPEFLRREAEQQVFREQLGGDYGGGSDAPPAASSFPGSVWQGIQDAGSWLGRQIGFGGDAEAYQSQSSYESLPDVGYGLPEE